MGDALSTGGKVAQGDLDGGAGLFAFNVAFSGPGDCVEAPSCLAWAAAPGFKMVLGGPVGSFFTAVRVGFALSAGFAAAA